MIPIQRISRKVKIYGCKNALLAVERGAFFPRGTSLVFIAKCQIQINQQALLCFVFICNAWMNTRPTGTKTVQPRYGTNKEVSYYKMCWLSGLKVMSNEQR